MVSTLQKRFASRNNKLRLLRSPLPTYQSPGRRQRCEFLDAVLFIHKLKLKLQAIQTEYSNLLAIKTEYFNSINQSHSALEEVKVEKIGEEFKVKVRCEKGGDRLVSILEAFEKMGLNVVQATVSCTECFSMEATAVAEDHGHHHQSVNVRDITEAIHVAIDGKLLLPANQLHQREIPEKEAEI